MRETNDTNSSLNTFEVEAVQELKAPTKRLLDQLRPSIESGTITAIVIDHVSGDIPGKIFAEAIWKIYAKKGFRRPEIHFLAMSSPLRKAAEYDNETKVREVAAYMNPVHARIVKDRGDAGKVIYLTEFVEMGLSAIQFLRSLKGKDWPIIVATIGLDKDQEEHAPERIKSAAGLNTPLIYGQIGAPRIYLFRDITGVEKVSEQPIHATPLAWRGNGNVRKADAAYTLAQKIGGELAEEYLLS